MAILNACVTQIDKYSFKVWDTTTEQMYAEAGIDLTSVTSAIVIFKNLYNEETYEITVTDDWAYILGDGLTINIVDFPGNKMDGYTYFPDYMYEITVQYVKSGRTYTSTRTIGFRAIITDIVFQRLQQADWVMELKCGCGCEKYNTSMRRFNYLRGLEMASENCLIADYIEILFALYKLTGTDHEYNS